MVTFVRKKPGAKWHIARHSKITSAQFGWFANTRCSKVWHDFPVYTHMPDNPDQVRANMGSAIRAGEHLCSTCALHDEALNEVFVKAGGEDPRPAMPVRPEAGGVWTNANRNMVFPLTLNFVIHDNGGWSEEAREQFRDEFIETIAPILELMAHRHNVSVGSIR